MDRTGTWKEVAVVVLVTAVFGTVSNLVASDARKLKWIGDMPLAAMVPSTPLTPDGATADTPEESFEIGTEAAYREWSDGALFLDARVSSSYYEGRIAGARNFAVWEGDIDGKVVNLMSEMPTDTRIVVYCTGGKCEDSHLLRSKLLAAGFTKVMVATDGIPAWREAGHPEEK